ncbi:uncharacterized protein C56G2.4-like isoform X2 [Dreissena polymorpha]|uniref:uncharacterized protein C56G2.4-like isoform X2 n=1 Tax=Dreissena polymorpha TaxID=45954 RepID=UPI0022641BCD|nr:uncharacterized protein C56G2.4-like isoform X2 [Dreissena polymorpha]
MMRMFAVVVVTHLATVLATPCSEQNRTSALIDCIDKVKTQFMDNDAFWFGRQYPTRCPGQGATIDPKCVNIRPDVADSLGTRLFKSNVINSIDRFLYVRFVSIGRNYTGCGTTYTWDGKERINIDVDPLSDDVETPWFVRNTPNITWSYNATDYYTLIVYDAGYLFAHAVYVNVRGNDLSSGQAVKEYHGPTLSFNLQNPYIFLLYKHSEPVNVTEQLRNIILRVNGTDLWPIHDFVQGLNLGDPVALNWMVVTGDEYAAAFAEEENGMFYCPEFSTNALHRIPRPFFSNFTQLSVWLDVTMTTSILHYSVCCNKFTFGAGAQQLDPIGNRIYHTADVRSEAIVTYSLKKAGYLPSDFTEMYSIVTMDPDVPSPTVGTQERPKLHGLFINIKDGNFSTGELVHGYSGPTPPDNKPHYYYFMLYRHDGPLNATTMPSYSSDPSDGRYLFDINRLVSDHNMTLVGANWLRATTDDYVTYRLVAREPANENSLCANYPGYSKPCPTSGSSRAFMMHKISLLFVGLSLRFVYIVFSALK